MTVILCILDGFGLGKPSDNNAIHLANTHNLDELLKSHPYSKLKTCGEAVGLPEGQMGNSEVGHITIGSGRIIYQDLPRISKACESGEIEKNPTLAKLIASGRPCHLIGLISDGGVHSHINHIIALYKILASNGIKVHLHAITDGRDVAPQSAKVYLSILSKNGITPSTLMGRFYAMDRDKRTERTERAFEAMVGADGKKVDSFEHAIDSSYLEGTNDEFIAPLIASGYKGMSKGENVLIANFRADRVRQISQKFIDEEGFGILAGMTEYSKDLVKRMEVLFRNQQPVNTLGEVLAKAGLKQFRIAETEKYAHVTYFLNGGREEVFVGEDRVMIPSPKVATYDLKPEMSAFEITEKLVSAINSKHYAFVCVNFANADMVGHSGNVKATIAAIEAVDKCLGKVMKACKAVDADLLVTADHGNAEELFDPKSNQPLTSHTMNPVPLIYYGKKKLTLLDGGLSDIASTILSILEIQIPAEFTGRSLIKNC